MLEAVMLISLACFIACMFLGYGLWVASIYPYLRKRGVRASIFYPRYRQYIQAVGMARTADSLPGWVTLFRALTVGQVASVSVFVLAVICILLRVYL